MIFVELWDLYTRDRQLSGKTHVRGEALPEGLYHLVVHVWIQNSRGEFLISRRAASRPTFPLLWECVGGSVLTGETSLEGAVREVREEVGIDLSGVAGRVVRAEVRDVVEGKPFNDILDVWLFSYDGEIRRGEATTDEVAEAKWMTREEIKALYDAHKLVHTLRYFFEGAF